jgi:translocation and assembly module TamB
LHGVRFTYAPDLAKPTERFAFTARTLVLDPALRPLLGRTLMLDALDVHGAVLELPPAKDEPFEFPRWPESLPAIAPPMSLRADTIRVDGLRVTQAGAPLIGIRSARLGLQASQGRLHVERLAMDSDRGQFTMHGDYVPRERYRTDLIATAVLPAAAGRTAPRLGLAAKGDVALLDVAVSGRAPAPMRATLILRGEPDPRWHVRAQSSGFDPALFAGSSAGTEPGTPLAFELRADGLGGRADVQGFVRQGELRADIRPSRVRLDDRVLTVEPLIVDALDGRMTLRGYADLRNPDRERLRFAINARGLRWGGTPDVPAVQGDADFGIAGKPDAWAAVGTATVLREDRRATLRFDARGDTERAKLHALQVRMPEGTLEAKGDVQWTPGLTWSLDATLDGFDPGYFAPRMAGPHRRPADDARQRAQARRLRRNPRCAIVARHAAATTIGCARDPRLARQRRRGRCGALARRQPRLGEGTCRGRAVGRCALRTLAPGRPDARCRRRAARHRPPCVAGGMRPISRPTWSATACIGASGAPMPCVPTAACLGDRAMVPCMWKPVACRLAWRWTG